MCSEGLAWYAWRAIFGHFSHAGDEELATMNKGMGISTVRPLPLDVENMTAA